MEINEETPESHDYSDCNPATCWEPIWVPQQISHKTVYKNDNTTTVTTLVEHEYYPHLPLQCNGDVRMSFNTKSAYKTFSEGLWTRFYTRNTCARVETEIDLWTQHGPQRRTLTTTPAQRVFERIL